MLYIKLFIEREKNTGQSAPECPFKECATAVAQVTGALLNATRLRSLLSALQSNGHKRKYD